MPPRAQRRTKDQGSVLVEFALASVTIFAVLFGIIDVARAAFAYDWVTNAARAGTRFMIVRGTTCPTDPVLLPGGCPATAQNLDNYIKNTTGTGLDDHGIDTSKITTHAACWSRSVFAPPPCPAGVAVKVNVTYTFNFITPFVPFIPPWNMTSSSQEIVQN